MRASISIAVLLSLVGAPAVPGQEAVRPTGSDGGAFDEAPLSALAERVAAGDYGYVDRILVLLDGRAAFDRRYEHDYAEISRGRSGPIGCGVDACLAPDDVHDFNYLHPDRHPFYRGRDVHTLQSVTKSVTATLIGVARDHSADKNVETFLQGMDSPISVSRVPITLSAAKNDSAISRAAFWCAG